MLQSTGSKRLGDKEDPKRKIQIFKGKGNRRNPLGGLGAGGDRNMRD